VNDRAAARFRAGSDRLPRNHPGATALAAGSAAALLLAAAILAGSRNLGNFDVALLGYAVGTVVLAFGATYRLVLWGGSPAARRYLARGWSALLGNPAGVPRATRARRIRAAGSSVLLQPFIAERGVARWLAHQGLFWGVVSATAITFPLTFGWIHFRSVAGFDTAYWIYVAGFRTAKIDALSIAGWLAFHGLNFSALLVLAGGGWFLLRRWRDRGENLTQLGRDVMPLVALMAISVTGLLLTLSSALLAGWGYRPMAVVHMCTVVLTLVWVPFGKFFHTVQRPAMAGVQLHKEASLQAGGPAACVSCGSPVEGAVFLSDLQSTMGELGLGYAGWVRTCPACKRLARGAAYLQTVKGGYR
jgi:hypothetical protein